VLWPLKTCTENCQDRDSNLGLFGYEAGQLSTTPRLSVISDCTYKVTSQDSVCSSPVVRPVFGTINYEHSVYLMERSIRVGAAPVWRDKTSLVWRMCEDCYLSDVRCSRTRRGLTPWCQFCTTGNWNSVLTFCKRTRSVSSEPIYPLFVNGCCWTDSMDQSILSRNSSPVVEPEGSLRCSEGPATVP
jgi:hypothetical protein